MNEKIDDSNVSHLRGYGGNANLKRAGETIEYTDEQLQEIIKCMNDPVYFVRNYMKIVNIDRGLIPFDLWDFQEELLGTFKDNKHVILKFPRQSSKCLISRTFLNMRKKSTGEIIQLSIGDFYKLAKKSKEKSKDISKLFSNYP